MIVDRFRRLGVIFVDDVTEVPPGAPLMLSAHGTAPDVVDLAKSRGGIVINSVCPLVTKVHHEVKVRASKGYHIIYVGHEGHEESVGTMAVAPESVHLVEREEDLANLPELDGAIALLAQTTLSHDEWSGIMEQAKRRHPDLWMPGRSDLCFATTNRQAALRAIAGSADAVVVLGSANSSNTVALTKVAAAAGAPRVLRINSSEELPDDLEGTIAVSAGASAPEELVNAVLARLAPRGGIQQIEAVEEDEYFPPPRELRELLRGVLALAGTMFGQPPSTQGPLADDRSIEASEVLMDLLATPTT